MERGSGMRLPGREIRLCLKNPYPRKCIPEEVSAAEEVLVRANSAVAEAEDSATGSEEVADHDVRGFRNRFRGSS